MGQKDELTDGQEVRPITRVGRSIRPDVGLEREIEGNLDPTDPDTDEDGYWDGWIGVYGVGYSDNVILYQSNLKSGSGVVNDEIVQEPVGYHEYRADAPFDVGTDIDDDGREEHSNLHLGELTWEMDPADGSLAPSPGFTLEVDYYEGADQALNDSSWAAMIEDNYQLYGINLTVERDQTVTDQDLYYLFRGDWHPPKNAPAHFSVDQLMSLERSSYYRSPGTDQYMFVAEGAHFDIPGGLNQTGIHRWRGVPNIIELNRFTSVFTYGHVYDPLGYGPELDDVPDRFNLKHDETIRVATAKTAVHEVGHILDLGESDDRNGDEVYSGSSADDQTLEVVQNTQPVIPQDVQEWSVMSSGVVDENFIPPTDTNYTAFSIEEWLSMDIDRVNP